jgi:PAS domain S-box-containing protein
MMEDAVTAGRAGSSSLPTELLQDVIGLASDAIVVVDELHRIVLFNRGAEEIFGYSASEAIGEPLSMLIPEPASAGHGAQVNGFAAGPVASLRSAHRGEISGLRRNGEVFPAEASISKHEIGGHRVYASIVRDISARKRQEAELRLLQAMALEIGAAADLDPAYQSALERVGQVTGWAAGEAWIPNATGDRFERGPVWTGGRSDLGTFHARSEGFRFVRGEGLVGRVWETGSPVWVHDLASCGEFIRRDTARDLGLHTAMFIPVLAGEEVVSVLAFYQFRERREDHHLLALVSAVAAQLGTLVQRKRAEAMQARQKRELEEQAAELARSNADLEQFVYVASHDLQEPLRMVASYTQLLERKYGERLDDEAREFIGYAVGGVRRMRELILDLLTYSRVGTRRGPLESTDANEVLAGTLFDLGPRIAESAATVAHDALPTVAADVVQIGQLLQNLIGNALKFHRPGVPPHVHVGARREGGAWVFRVADNGIGIEPEFRDRIFEIFQRLHSRDEYPGTGIGLAICRKIVERHGGRIWVESEPGGGTAFCFTLPPAGSAD